MAGDFRIKMSLYDEKHNMGIVKDEWYFPEEDVKKFIRELKDKIDMDVCFIDDEEEYKLTQFINKLAGKELIEEDSK